MQVSILTVDRSPNPNYLRQTFERLRLARRRYRTWFNAEIVLGNQGTSHLPETIPPWTKLITPTEAEQQIIDDLDFPTKHHAYNYNRILKSSEENLLLLEDDALLSHDFFFDLKKMVSYAHSIGSSFIINLFDSRVHEEGQPRLEVEPAGGFGTVAMYFSGQARKAVRDQSYHRTFETSIQV